MKKLRLFTWLILGLVLLPACKRINLDKKFVMKKDVPVAEAANCYIIAPGGFLSFPAVKGNTGNVLTYALEAAVMWETDNTAKAVKKGSIIKNISFANGTVSLEAGSKEGNALVVVEDGDGLVLWSWHIWVTLYYPDNYLIPITSSMKIMDRNLGALTSTPTDPLSFGLLYFDSRKDPFPGMAAFHEMYTSDTGNGTVRAAVTGYLNTEPVKAADLGEDLEEYMRKNPQQQVNYFGVSRNSGALWSDSGKSVSDPCPYGYRVASRSVWSNVNSRASEATFTPKCADWSATSDWHSFALPQCGYGPATRNYLICIQNPSTDNKGMRYSAYMVPQFSASSPDLIWLGYNDGSGTYTSSVHFSSGLSYLASGAVRCMKM